MTAIDTEALLSEYAATRSVPLRDKIVESNLRYAAMIARKFLFRGAEYDDLYQVACMALLNAVERFESGRGLKFSTFAIPTMVGAVKNYLRDNSSLIHLPRSMSEKTRLIETARQKLQQALLREPTVAELANDLRVDEFELLTVLESVNISSLDAAATDEEDGMTLSEAIGSTDEGYRLFETRDMLQRAGEYLTERQREIIYNRFELNLSQRDTADKMNLSQMTVSRQERAALQTLREHIQGENE